MIMWWLGMGGVLDEFCVLNVDNWKNGSGVYWEVEFRSGMGSGVGLEEKW